MLGYVLLHTNTVQWNGGDLYIEGGSMVMMYVFFSQNTALIGANLTMLMAANVILKATFIEWGMLALLVFNTQSSITLGFLSIFGGTVVPPY